MSNDTNMLFASFNEGRLSLLAGDGYGALNHYARGIHYVRAGASVWPSDLLSMEVQYLKRVIGEPHSDIGYRWCLDLFDLARRMPTQETALSVQPVLIIAGAAATMTADEYSAFQSLLVEALPGFTGTIISGGTTIGVPGCVGEVVTALRAAGGSTFNVMGYLPRIQQDGASPDMRYDELVTCGDNGFSPEQILKSWIDLADAGTAISDIRLLGFGGGRIAACEYRIALALGATVGIILGSGGSADELLKDAAWNALPNLFSLPDDPQRIRAFVHPSEGQTSSTAICLR